MGTSHWLIKMDSKNQKVEIDVTEERTTLQRHQVGKILQKSKTPKLKFKPRNEFTEVNKKITEYYLTHKKYRDDSLKNVSLFRKFFLAKNFFTKIFLVANFFERIFFLTENFIFGAKFFWPIF